MRSIGKGRLYTCTKHPNHQISLARLMMLVCSIKKKKKTLSRVVILLLKMNLLENNINYILGPYLIAYAIGLRWFFDIISEP
jgi:hypothetical protein